MGWFSSTPAKEDITAQNRQGRQKCWDSRDAYFACLDKAQVVKAGAEGNACSQEKEKYEGNCAKSWIEYFNQRRVIADAQKERLSQASEQAPVARK